MSLADAERWVEEAYREVVGVFNPGLSLDVGHATAQGMDTTQRGALFAGRIEVIRTRLEGTALFSVLELKYRPRGYPGLEEHLCLAAELIAMKRGMARAHAVNAINKITHRAHIDINEWAEACNVSVNTVNIYLRSAKAELERLRENACIRAFEG